jgi:hypothetical protein
MTRGFLWENLGEEIVAEFDSAQSPMSLYDLDKARIPFFIIERLSALEVEREPMLPALKKRRARARAVATGRCVKCPEMARPDKKMCAICATEAAEKTKNRRRGMKERLGTKESTDRSGITHHFTITTKCERCSEHAQPRENCRLCRGAGVYEIKGYIIANAYPDGRLGEIFLNIGKTSSSEAWIDQWARAASFALQYGAPADEFFGKFIATRFEPSGPTNNKAIRHCTSVLDYVARWVLLRFGTAETREKLAQTAASVEAVQP